MSHEPKKVAAALAAVNAFLEQERRVEARPVLTAATTMWAVAGRLDMMTARAGLASMRRR